MDTQDFTMPSPKRQRTESPKPALDTNGNGTPHTQPLPTQTTLSQDVELKPVSTAAEEHSVIPGLGAADMPPESQHIETQIPITQTGGFLDVLMEHVESLSQPEPEEAVSSIVPEPFEQLAPLQTDTPISVDGPVSKTDDTKAEENGIASQAPTGLDQELEEKGGSEHKIPADVKGMTAATGASPQVNETFNETKTEQDQTTNDGQQDVAAEPAADTAVANRDQAMIEADHPAASETMDAQGAEWEADSSPYVSSDSDGSSDTTTDDSDDDADGDYAMLDPEEQARILMAGDGGSDDEGDKKGKTEGGHLRTANEKVEEVVPKPDIVVTEEMGIEELGSVEGVIEKTVLVKAKISGEYQVLESNSLLCLADRSVVGVVAEPLGRVEQPMYTVRFTNDDAIKEAGLYERGTKVFYVPQHSTFVFTQPLRAVKGSDASNFHDEEVGDEEMEFSDDEQEAEHKRQLKMKRQGRRDEQGGGRGRGSGGRGNHQRGARQESRAPSSNAMSIYSTGATEISYDDIPEGADEGYTPLVRPANLDQMMAEVQREPREGSHYSGRHSQSGDSNGGRSRGRGRGRGDRDSRGRRGGRGGGSSTQPSWTTYQNTSATPSDSYHNHPSPQSMAPPTHFPFQYQQQYPSQPRLSPQNQAFSPSPISPLAPNHFNFNFTAQQQAQPWPGAQAYQQPQPPPQLHPYEQLHQARAPAQYGAQQFVPLQQQGQGQANTNTNNGWSPNQVGAAHVAAQLEQFRKSQGQ